MEVDHQQENFEGNPEDLKAFLELAKSPIRSEARKPGTRCLAAIQAAKAGRTLAGRL